VTFLFTDIERSTQLWESVPDAMRPALERHDELVRRAIDAHSGYVFSTGGDGFAVAFGRAGDAVNAAIAMQRALAAEPWPDGVPVGVRVGLHSGEASERGGDYFGPAVNHAARLMAAAHGGQVVCTGAVAELVADHLELRDLGVHRLRDLESVTHVWQVDVPGWDRTFPPLRSLDAFRSNLPHDLSVFVGRDDDVAAVLEALGQARLVSVIGVGGVGKTRLALRVGSELLPEFADGVWLCELAPVREAGEIAEAVAVAVGVPPTQGVSATVGLRRFFAHKQMLLILDNCEHLLGDVARFIGETCGAAERISVLVTSREALAVRGERVCPLPSLGLPIGDEADAIVASDAGALFVTRARDARGDFSVSSDNATAIRELLARLDGIPLAIELAAARTAMMSPAEILGRLDQRFRLLTGGSRTALERHQTLRAAIDWSYEILDADERALLNRLSVFVGGFDLDAATALAKGAGLDDFAAVDVLGSLVAKSLVERNEASGTTRYRLLEMIRQYAAEHLDAAGDAAGARDDHAAYFLTLAKALFGQLRTPKDFDALERLAIETPNLTAAARWLLDTDQSPDLMAFFEASEWLDFGMLPFVLLDELGRIAAEVVRLPGAAGLPGYVQTCYCASMWCFYIGDIDRHRTFTDLAQAIPGERPLYITINVAGQHSMRGDMSTAAAMARSAVDQARERGDAIELAFTLTVFAFFEAFFDETAAAAAAREAVEFARTTGAQSALVYALTALARATQRTQPDQALMVCDECVHIDRTQRRGWSNMCQATAASIHVQRGEIAEGLPLYRSALQHFDWVGDRTQISVLLAEMAEALAPIDPSNAIQLAAISESDTIAPYAILGVAQFANLAAAMGSLRSGELESARSTAAAMSYDDALRFAFATIDRLTDEPPRST
jgi:predicted ATPase/class 3 adenylate cyclase